MEEADHQKIERKTPKIASVKADFPSVRIFIQAESLLSTLFSASFFPIHQKTYVPGGALLFENGAQNEATHLIFL